VHSLVFVFFLVNKIQKKKKYHLDKQTQIMAQQTAVPLKANQFCKNLNGSALSSAKGQLNAPMSFKRLQAAIVTKKQWPPGKVIKIMFMEGTSEEREIVERVVLQVYAPIVNLTFEFFGPNQISDSDVRITFRPNDGAWSYLGTDAYDIPKNQPTMNLGWLDRNNDYGVVKHEFGHCLGMIHEHQNPDDTNVLAADWNKQVVINDLSGSPNNWSAETIQHNMFNKYNAADVTATTWDKTSIMEYSFPASWTHSGINIPMNQHLSDMDVAFLRRVYDKPGGGETPSVEETGGGDETPPPVTVTETDGSGETTTGTETETDGSGETTTGTETETDGSGKTPTGTETETGGSGTTSTGTETATDGDVPSTDGTTTTKTGTDGTTTKTGTGGSGSVTETQDPSASMSPWLIVLIVVLCLFVLAVILYFVYRNRSTEKRALSSSLMSSSPYD
jgi:hypothetical protein